MSQAPRAVHIDEIVLTGVPIPAGRVEQLRRDVSTELAAFLTQRGLPELPGETQGSSPLCLSHSLPTSLPDLSRGLAEAIYRALSEVR